MFLRKVGELAGVFFILEADPNAETNVDLHQNNVLEYFVILRIQIEWAH